MSKLRRNAASRTSRKPARSISKSSESPRRHSSGMVATSGAPTKGELMIGDNLANPIAIAFQLAPRLYLLSREQRGKRKPIGSLLLAAALKALPPRLVFEESTGDVCEQVQRWVSLHGGTWRWQLVVKQCNGKIEAVLYADRPLRADEPPLCWKPCAAWNSFGSNRFHFEQESTTATSLIVAAP